MRYILRPGAHRRSEATRPVRVLGAITATTLAITGLALAPQAAAAAPPPPTIEYSFNGSLADSQGASTLTVLQTCPSTDPTPGWTACNATTGFGSDAAGPYWEWSSSNARGGGFTVNTSAPVGNTYTIALKFSFSSVSGFRKIIDYAARTSDRGFYFLNGRLQFYPGDSGSVVYPAGTVLDLIAVRDASVSPPTFTVYAVGSDGALTPQFSYPDPGGDAIPDIQSGRSLLGFFFDDVDTSGEATPSGRVYSLKVWSNTALTAQEIEESISGSTSAGDSPRPADILQQLPLAGTSNCTSVGSTGLAWVDMASGGWSPSWSQWPDEGRGGYVCTRTLTFNSRTSKWVVASS